MQVFLTSATGYVGAAVAAALRARGHSVTALARSPSSTTRLRDSGVQPVPGELAQPETYKDAATAADAVVHTAFEYSADGAENLDLDAYATRALLTSRRLIYTSNGYLPGIDTERLTDTISQRFATERMVLTSDTSASNAVIRLGMVYGGQGGGTITSLFATAQRHAQLPCPPDVADNRWSLIHLDDLAALYVALAESSACGVFHAVDGRPLSVRRTLECIGAACGAPVAMQSEKVAANMLEQHTFDVMKRDVALDAPRARALGWSPRYPEFTP
jgi:nucleoside-diphosphate-sugar epimerase